LQKILSLLEAEDADSQIYAVKIIANLACEGFSVANLSLNTLYINSSLKSRIDVFDFCII